MSNQPSDATELRNSLTREVSNDAYAISSQIFRGQEGDVARVSNDQVDERYRQAFASNDRSYLMQEAARDPNQFLASMQRLGVTMPAGEELQPEPKLPAAAKANVPVPKPPAAASRPSYDQPDQVPAPTPLSSVPPVQPPPPAAPMPTPAPPPALPLAPSPAAVPPPPGVIA